MTQVTQAPRAARRSGWLSLGGAAVATAVVAGVLALAVAPADSVQGQSQRLMYVHVPSAWTAFLSFAAVWLSSAAVLLRVGRRWDAVAQAAAELGVVMTALAIAEGSIWGHEAWGVWWTWDPRLVTTALLLVLYIAYLAMRALPGDPVRTSRRAAVAGVLFFAQVPIVHFSVLWWRTLHQPPTLLRPSLSPPMDPVMLLALLCSLAAFTLGGAWYVRRRVAQLTAPDADPQGAPVAAPSAAAPAAAPGRPAADPVLSTSEVG